MDEAKIITGANWGDEGKGLMTDYFSKDGKNTLVICHNGGCQRGHTVVKGNTRHVFHHFGSGTFNGAPTYLAGTFLLNPVIFMKEYRELLAAGYPPSVYANKECMLTTPYDMLANQSAENRRGDGRHGSCGVGIFETIKRDEKIPFRLMDALKASKADMIKLLADIACFYVETRDFTKREKEILMSGQVRERFMKDLAGMMSAIKTADDGILGSYKRAVFEGGQGLALDQGNEKYFPHLTPSNTGGKNPAAIMDNAGGFDNVLVEACYVTRSYFTRHGAGPFETECQKGDISPDIQDLTNMPNEFQGTLRFGFHDMDDMLDRILDDLENYRQDGAFRGAFTKSIAVTHLNYTKGLFRIGKGDFGSLYVPGFQIYRSFSEFADEVKKGIIDY